MKSSVHQKGPVFSVTHDPLTAAAKKYFGLDYLFPYQRLVITNTLEAAGVEGFSPEPELNTVTGETEIYDTRPNQIVILPTGAGKSLCFMLPGILLRGMTLVVFPLLSLIEDQRRRLDEAGISSVVLRGSQSREERGNIWKQIESGNIRFILTNPETALSPAVLSRLGKTVIDHIVIDEAHTVSEWGNTFRPVYLRLSELVAALINSGNRPVVTAFTATASEEIVNQIKTIVFKDRSPELITANPDRPNIRYSVIPSISVNQSLLTLARELSADPSRMPLLVFTRSRTGAELAAAELRMNFPEKEIYYYHAGLSADEKKRIEEWFYSSPDGILAATCAYGMGVDKKNIRTVLHLEPPETVEAYLQESGRAGRDRQPAEAILLVSYSRLPGKNVAAGAGQVHGSRYSEFVRAVTDSTRCRREALLELMHAEPEYCFGCDVCNKTAVNIPAGSEEIKFLVKRNNRRLTPREAALTLIGSRYSDVINKRLFLLKGYRSLKGWSYETAREAIDTMAAAGKVRIPRRGPYRHRISLSKKNDTSILKLIRKGSPAHKDKMPKRKPDGIAVR